MAYQNNFVRALERYAEIYPDDVDEYRKLKSLTEVGQPLSDMNLSDFAHQDRGVNLTTIHSSKGAEFDVVIVLGVEAIKENKNGQRLLYVGATRAKRELHLVYTKIKRTRYPAFPKYIKELRTKFRKIKNPSIVFHD
ncbi:MAG: 3'-5' exonuclease [Caldilineaceae bacterium]